MSLLTGGSKQRKTNTTLGMFRGRPNKTNRHNYFGDQDRSNGDDSDSSQDEPKSNQPLKKESLGKFQNFTE